MSFGSLCGSWCSAVAACMVPAHDVFREIRLGGSVRAEGLGCRDASSCCTAGCDLVGNTRSFEDLPTALSDSVAAGLDGCLLGCAPPTRTLLKGALSTLPSWLAGGLFYMLVFWICSLVLLKITWFAGALFRGSSLEKVGAKVKGRLEVWTCHLNWDYLGSLSGHISYVGSRIFRSCVCGLLRASSGAAAAGSRVLLAHPRSLLFLVSSRAGLARHISGRLQFASWCQLCVLSLRVRAVWDPGGFFSQVPS